jgi:hypothetical protein
MRSASIILLVASLFLAAGCATTTSERVSQPGGITHDRVTYDGPSDTDERADALKWGRRSLGDLAAWWYEHEDNRPDFAPPTLSAFTSEATCTLVPVFEYNRLTTDATSIYDVTREKAGEFMLLSFLDGEFVAACDWYRPGADESWHPGPWFSFYGLGGLELPRAIGTLKKHLETQELQVRVVGVPRGWWVVGRASGQEKAVFIQRQGDYEDDPRGEIYTLQQVLAYGAPHADGN